MTVAGFSGTLIFFVFPRVLRGELLFLALWIRRAIPGPGPCTRPGRAASTNRGDGAGGWWMRYAYPPYWDDVFRKLVGRVSAA